ncbi:hypothetical protein MBLNU13_g06833t1 [Cladosporium sp. NU13]
MSWPYAPFPIRHTAMDPLRRPQQPTLSPQYQRLINLINERPNTNTDSDWDDIRVLRFSTEELEFATDYALNVYTQWLMEDLRLLWPLLGGEQGENAMDAMRDASDWLDRIARDRHRARSNVDAILLRLCQARWKLRSSANAISQAAGT